MARRVETNPFEAAYAMPLEHGKVRAAVTRRPGRKRIGGRAVFAAVKALAARWGGASGGRSRIERCTSSGDARFRATVFREGLPRSSPGFSSAPMPGLCREARARAGRACGRCGRCRARAARHGGMSRA
jgi:hypothetical protein